MIGENIKVLLPGERPWVKVIGECRLRGDEEAVDRFKGRIINKLFHEYSEHEQARFMKRECGDVSPLESLHSFKQGDELWFEVGDQDRTGWWVPVENMN